MPFRVEYEEASSIELDDVTACMELACSVHEKSLAVGAQFHRPNGESLSVVLGAPVSYLVYMPADYDSTATGSLSSSSDTFLLEPLDFWLCGHHGQIPPENAIDTNTMFETLDRFLLEGGAPNTVDWVKD